MNVSMPGAWPGLSDISPSLSPITQNKTMYIAKFTDELPMDPLIVDGLESVSDVFENFQPEKTVTIYAEPEPGQKAGMPHFETYTFRSLGDFSQQGLVDQSPVMQEQFTKVGDLAKISMHLRSNKMLQEALKQPESKRVILEMIQQMMDEIDQANLANQ
jgi:hypothetical protein